MPGPGSGYPEAESFVTPARLALVGATRRLVSAVLAASDVDDHALEEATRATEHATEQLGRPSSDSSARTRHRPRGDARHEDYLPRSPLVGTVSPVAPPFSYELGDGRVRARGEFGVACEGPPGYVHGGWVALAFDEALGMANAAGGRSGMTGRLTVRYRRPTPLHTEMRLEAWIARVDGRRVTTMGTLHAGDQLTAEAEGLFVALGAERVLEYFGERTPAPEPTDPLP